MAIDRERSGNAKPSESSGNGRQQHIHKETGEHKYMSVVKAGVYCAHL